MVGRPATHPHARRRRRSERKEEWTMRGINDEINVRRHTGLRLTEMCSVGLRVSSPRSGLPALSVSLYVIKVLVVHNLSLVILKDMCHHFDERRSIDSGMVVRALRCMFAYRIARIMMNVACRPLFPAASGMPSSVFVICSRRRLAAVRARSLWEALTPGSAYRAATQRTASAVRPRYRSAAGRDTRH